MGVMGICIFFDCKFIDNPCLLKRGENEKFLKKVLEY